MYCVSISILSFCRSVYVCLFVCIPSIFLCLSCGRVWRMKIRTVNWPSCSHPFWSHIYMPPQLPLYHFSPSVCGPLSPLCQGPHHPPPDSSALRLLGPSVAWSALHSPRSQWPRLALLTVILKSDPLRVHTEWVAWCVFTGPVDTCHQRDNKLWLWHAQPFSTVVSELLDKCEFKIPVYLCVCFCGLQAALCLWFLLLKDTGRAPLFPWENSGLSKTNTWYCYDFAPTIPLLLFCKDILVELEPMSDVACYPSPNGPPSHKLLWGWAAIDGGIQCSATNTETGLGAHSTQLYRTQDRTDIRERGKTRVISG